MSRQRMNTLIAGIIVLSVCAPVLAQTPDASFRDLVMIAKVCLKYRAMKSLTQNVHGKMTVTAEGVTVTADIASTVRLAQPDRFALDTTVKFAGSEKHGLAVSDGKTLWEYDADAKQYSEQPFATVGKNPDKLTDWLMDRGFDLSILLFLQAAGNEALGLAKGADQSIDVKGYPTRLVDGVATYVIPVPFDTKSAGGTSGTATIYSDAKDLLMRRCRINVKPPAEKGSPKNLRVDVVLFYDSIKTDPELADSTFTFTPPAGAKKVDSVKPAFDRAFD